MTDRHDTPAGPDAHDDDAPMTPAEMLALSRRQEDRVEDFFQTPTTIIVVTWGIAWTVGFMALWLASDASPIAVPAGPAGVVFTTLMVAGIIISGVVGMRSGAGMRGPQHVQEMIYGITWAVGCLAVPMLAGALFRAGMSADIAALYFPAGYCIVIGILYLFGAALFSDRSMIVVGGWILLIGIVAPYVGTPGNFLVMSLAGGGAFLVYGIALLVARARRATGVRNRG